MDDAADASLKRDRTSFVPITRLAYHTGLSVSWLRAEAQANRIPSIRMGRRWMFNIDAVERALLERASVNEPDQVSKSKRAVNGLRPQ